MKNYSILIYLFIGLFIPNFISCESNKDFIGSWDRNIDDREYKGTEILQILQNDSIIMGSNLLFNGEEEGFAYQMKFEVSIKGVWRLDRRDLLIDLDLDSYNFNEIPDSFHVYLTNQDNKEYNGDYKEEMNKALKEELSQRFFNFYINYDNSPYILKNIKVDNNTLSCNSDVSFISFQRIK